MIDSNIAFLGAGQMARALARGWLAAGLTTPDRLTAFDVSAEAAAEFARETGGARLAASNREAARPAGVVLLAVKPQAVPTVLADLRDESLGDKLLVSIAAGVSLATLQAGCGARVVRVMPNTPCLVGQGAAAFALGAAATAADAALTRRLFNAVGAAHELPEKLLDAVTGLSGSGPAYVFLLIEALSDGGVRVGLPRAAATALAAQTVLGAAALVLQSGEHPAVLKDRVASPGGTTIAGLRVLEQRAVRGALIDAVEAATLRARELGGG